MLPHLNGKPNECKALMEVFFWREVITSLSPFPHPFPLFGHVGVISALTEKLQASISDAAQGTVMKFSPNLPQTLPN